MTDDLEAFEQVGRRAADQEETVRANRSWWDGEAVGYYAEHGAFLGDTDFVWGPEGAREEELHLLGDVRGKRVLEIGAGAAQCSRYLAGLGAQVVASDLSGGMLRQGRAIDAPSSPAPGTTAPGTTAPGTTGTMAPGTATARTTAVRTPVPLVQCDAAALPFGDAAFDTVFTAYGVVPFVADSALVMQECARVLRPGGRLVFSTTHPIRWAFADDPGPEGLVARLPYFDRTPYVEADASGRATYVEHHRTLGDRVRELTAAGLRLVDLVEPEWPETNGQEWGGWSPLRGAIIPGTAIFVAEKPARAAETAC
ncbi:class I SAM-dependent methyltransferase [Oryzihumus sp.]|uniref:class I SAM-dependent methyltransferase n=1 Tax=Oryzihumus sp. TaxID=1968903 RepID=UPI002EDB9FB2